MAPCHHWALLLLYYPTQLQTSDTWRFAVQRRCRFAAYAEAAMLALRWKSAMVCRYWLRWRWRLGRLCMAVRTFLVRCSWRQNFCAQAAFGLASMLAYYVYTCRKLRVRAKRQRSNKKLLDAFSSSNKKLLDASAAATRSRSTLQQQQQEAAQRLSSKRKQLDAFSNNKETAREQQQNRQRSLLSKERHGSKSTRTATRSNMGNRCGARYRKINDEEFTFIFKLCILP
ncbi:hypothetical protein NPIL_320831 [Nephila pilipes]|uniref:Uncharacterized protein n=1 Tax=Nephila pilipes TaxID=299642 RepID=A0A8X6NHI2_NEPPI|nr:hypothetical protein NPIL_320831 [Nephila pilipes]